MKQIELKNEEDVKAELLRLAKGMQEQGWIYNQSLLMRTPDGSKEKYRPLCGCLLGFRLFEECLPPEEMILSSYCEVYTGNTDAKAIIKDVFDSIVEKDTLLTIKYFLGAEFAKEFESAMSGVERDVQ